MQKKYKIPLPFIGILIFIALYMLDSIFIFLRYKIGLYFPIGFISYIVAIILLFKLIFRKRQIKKNFSVLSFLLLFIILSNLILLCSGSYDTAYLYLSFQYCIYFSIGYYVANYINTNGINLFITAVLYIFPIAYILFMLNIGAFELIKSNEGINYLRLSNNVAMLGIMTLAITRNKKVYILLLLLYSVCLYLLISRAGIFIFLAASIWLYWYRYGIKKVFLLFTPLFILFLNFLVYQFNHNPETNRFYRLIFNISGDTSLRGRLLAFDHGIKIIKNNPFFGKYGWQIAELGEHGLYIHNILSFWTQFGVFIFIMALIIAIYPVVKIYKRRSNNNTLLVDYGLTVSIYVIINVIFAKAFVYEALFFPFGVYMYINSLPFKLKKARSIKDLNN